MRYPCLALLLLLLFPSCEEVIDADLGTAQERLVVEASINWEKDTSGAYQSIRLTKTTGFYETEIPPAIGAQVNIIDDEGNTFYFNENEGGYYTCNYFLPRLGHTYELVIHYENEVYEASESLMPVPELVYSDQADEGFTQNDIIVRAFFQDPPDEKNFYMHRFIREIGSKSGVFSDEFVNGQVTFTGRIVDDAVPGEFISITMYGISSRYYDYMFKLFSFTTDQAGGPFKVTPIAVRGNVRNTTNEANYAMGYFRLSEASQTGYTVQ